VLPSTNACLLAATPRWCGNKENECQKAPCHLGCKRPEKKKKEKKKKKKLFSIPRSTFLVRLIGPLTNV
jgi:hypothetical protein